MSGPASHSLPRTRTGGAAAPNTSICAFSRASARRQPPSRAFPLPSLDRTCHTCPTICRLHGRARARPGLMGEEVLQLRDPRLHRHPRPVPHQRLQPHPRPRPRPSTHPRPPTRARRSRGGYQSRLALSRPEPPRRPSAAALRGIMPDEREERYARAHLRGRGGGEWGQRARAAARSSPGEYCVVGSRERLSAMPAVALYTATSYTCTRAHQTHFARARYTGKPAPDQPLLTRKRDPPFRLGARWRARNRGEGAGHGGEGRDAEGDEEGPAQCQQGRVGALLVCERVT